MEENKIDINSLIGFFLMGLVFIGWMYLNPPQPPTVNPQEDNATLPENSKEDNASSTCPWTYRIRLAPFIVIETLILSSGIPSNKIFISSTLVMNMIYFIQILI